MSAKFFFLHLFFTSLGKPTFDITSFILGHFTLGRCPFYSQCCVNGHSEIAEMIMKNASSLKIDLNIKGNDGSTAFHIACKKGLSKVAELIMKSSSELSIDLNIKEEIYGRTAFHLVCYFGHLKIAEMIMKNASELSIDLNVNGKYGWTAFYTASL